MITTTTLTLAKNNWNGLNFKQRKGALSQIFPDMPKGTAEKLSKLCFNKLPINHPGTQKNIPVSLIMAATKQGGFSAQMEKKCRQVITKLST